MKGRTPGVENEIETILDLMNAGGASMIYRLMGDVDIERIMRYPFTMVGSDGEVPVFGQAAPHPRSYGTFARVLGVYVREKHIITLEDAVHRMSGVTAARLKLGI